jgi:hypothetical protein
MSFDSLDDNIFSSGTHIRDLRRNVSRPPITVEDLSLSGNSTSSNHRADEIRKLIQSVKTLARAKEAESLHVSGVSERSSFQDSSILLKSAVHTLNNSELFKTRPRLLDSGRSSLVEFLVKYEDYVQQDGDIRVVDLLDKRARKGYMRKLKSPQPLLQNPFYCGSANLIKAMSGYYGLSSNFSVFSAFDDEAMVDCIDYSDSALTQFIDKITVLLESHPVLKLATQKQSIEGIIRGIRPDWVRLCIKSTEPESVDVLLDSIDQFQAQTFNHVWNC